MAREDARPTEEAACWAPAALRRIADLQSAGRGKFEALRVARRSAECNSAIQQIENLRYGGSAGMRPVHSRSFAVLHSIPPAQRRTNSSCNLA
jgi:hypothetical protein